MSKFTQDFPVYRTTELTEAQKDGICNLFEEVFKHKKERQFFDRQFGKASSLGSYHCLAEQDGKIVATYSYIPYTFSINGEKVQGAVGVDTAVSSEAKIGEFGVYFMYQSLIKKMKEDGIQFVYGFPNDNFYGYNVRILGLKDIGIYDFYIVPVNLGIWKKSLRFFSPCLFQLSRFVAKTAAFFASKEVVHKQITLMDSATFREQRYDERHIWGTLSDGSKFVFMKYHEEKFGDVAYIVNFEKMSAKNYYEAVLYIMNAMEQRISMIAFPVAKMPFASIFHVPKKVLPRKLHMVGTIFDSKIDESSFFSIDSWKADLSIFDVR